MREYCIPDPRDQCDQPVKKIVINPHDPLVKEIVQDLRKLNHKLNAVASYALGIATGSGVAAFLFREQPAELILQIITATFIVIASISNLLGRKCRLMIEKGMPRPEEEEPRINFPKSL